MDTPMWPFESPDIAKLEAQKNIKTLLKILDSKKEQWLRRSAVEALGRIGDRGAVAPLIGYLEDIDQEVRLAVIDALGCIGDDRAVEPLIAAFKRSKYPVSYQIPPALGKLGDVRAIALLVDALSDDDIGVRQSAAEALGLIGDERAVAPLISALKQEWRLGKKVMAQALVHIKAPKTEQLVATLKDENKVVRHLAAKILEIIGWKPATKEEKSLYYVARRRWRRCLKIGEPAIQPLVAVIRGMDSHIRYAAAITLEKIGWKPKPGEEEAIYRIARLQWDECVEIGSVAIEPLIRTLDDKNPEVRERAIQTLGRIGDARAIAPLIPMLKDVDSDVRLASAITLRKFGWNPSSMEEEAYFYLADRQWDRCAVIGKSVAGPLIMALSDKCAHVREMASDILNSIGWEPKYNSGEEEILAIAGQRWYYNAQLYSSNDFHQALMVAIKDKNSEIRNSAALATDNMSYLKSAKENAHYYVAKKQWGRCITIGKHARPPLINVLDDKDPDVRFQAAITLDAIGWNPALKEKEKLYYVAKQQWDRCVEIGASAISSMLIALDDPDPKVREKVVTALGRIGDTHVIEPLVPMLDDSDSNVRLTAEKVLRELGWTPNQLKH